MEVKWLLTLSNVRTKLVPEMRLGMILFIFKPIYSSLTIGEKSGFSTFHI
jgi:hypothetical protein